MTVLVEILDDDQLARLNAYEPAPKRGWALRGSGLYRDGVLIGALVGDRARYAISYEMKPRSTDLIVTLRYLPISEYLAQEKTP